MYVKHAITKGIRQIEGVQSKAFVEDLTVFVLSILLY